MYKFFLDFLAWYISLGFILGGFINKQRLTYVKYPWTFKTNIPAMLLCVFCWPYFYFWALLTLIFDVNEKRDLMIDCFKSGWSMNPFGNNESNPTPLNKIY